MPKIIAHQFRVVDQIKDGCISDLIHILQVDYNERKSLTTLVHFSVRQKLVTNEQFLQNLYLILARNSFSFL